MIYQIEIIGQLNGAYWMQFEISSQKKQRLIKDF